MAYPVPDDVPLIDLNTFGRGKTPEATLKSISVFRRVRPDILYTHGVLLSSCMGLARRLSGSRCAWFPCFQDILESLRFIKPIVGSILRGATRYFAVSNKVADTMSERLNLPRALFVNTPNSVDFSVIDRYHWKGPESDGVPRIVTMGRFSWEKDHATLIRAFALLRRTRPAELVLIGDGPLKESYRQLAKSLGVAQDVTFTGWLAEPFSVLSNGNVFVLPSLSEGFGLALAEAMGAGLPCISTRCQGPQEIIQDGENGILVDIGDPEGMAAAMEMILSNPERAAILARRGAETARERYSAESQIRVLERIFENSAAAGSMGVS